MQHVVGVCIEDLCAVGLELRVLSHGLLLLDLLEHLDILTDNDLGETGLSRGAIIKGRNRALRLVLLKLFV